mgnify:FL=1
MKKNIKNILEYFLLISFYKISKFIGIRFSSLLGGVVLFVYGKFSLKNKIALKNLNKVFPSKNLKQKKTIINRMWFHFGRVIGEYPHLEKFNALGSENITIEGLENLTDPLKKNKNCLFFSAHLGNWELTSHPLTELGYTISFIYRPPNNPLVDDLLRRIRKKYGVNLIRKGPSGAKECIKVLKSNKGNIGMLMDQKMNDGIKANFFGYEVMTASAIARFAIKFKCPIIPAICKRVNGTRFLIKYYPEIKYEKILELESELNIINYLNRYIETWIKESPEQWIWVHNRW